MEDWVLLKVLGEGSCGLVCLAKQITKEESDLHYYFAVKRASLRYNSASLLWEEHVLKHLTDCPEIVQYLGSEVTGGGDFLDDKELYNLKLEYAAGGTLADLIKQRNKLPEDEVKKYLQMILKGLSCIHRKGFVHVDLKPDNILAFPQSDGKMKLKIADFGLAERFKHGEDDQEDKGCEHYGALRVRATHRYMSPESIVLKEIDGLHDIWSLGCVLVQMVSGERVWNDCKNYEELMTKLLNSKEIPIIPKELSKQGIDFLEKCFVRDYKQRWTADMLLQHPYLNEQNKDTSDDEKLKLPKTAFLPHQFFNRKADMLKNGDEKLELPKKAIFLPHQFFNSTAQQSCNDQ
ncbi:serine/threonine-protein kinase Chk1-like [Cucumis melo var. makuwa]|uniref:Serine/threonine-protein kinase Chk1-like n=1 Tax=Cucumis melo var. makuwa TaxID=1194695 RepID=A0A5A7TZP4_CUCMM|nr:serine/threonine-protein kinase Chk1-like [Cucumis melo var. makuwa]TYK18235.1 serine/threonine-protein kinase Chk1-like [Cucumis melo var. makuwa]